MADFLTRLGDDLAGDIRALDLAGARANAALRTALAATLAVLAAFALHLDNPWWAGITGVVLVQSDRGATLARSLDRVIGTTIGAAIGYLAAATIADHLVFLAIAAGCTGFAIYAQERADHGYAFLLGGITVVLVLFGTLAAPGKALDLAVYRALEIYLGVAVACAVDYTLAAPHTLAAAPPRPGVFARPMDRDLAAIAITGGIAIALIPLVWETLDLPGLGQTPITAFVILVAMRQEPGWRGFTRAVGCLLGGLWGLVAMHLAGGTFLLWLPLLFTGLFLAAHINHGQGDAAYVGLQAAIAVVVSMVQGLGPSADITPALNRLIGVFGGVIVVSLCQPLVAPLVRRLIGTAG
ncbi:MAG TPA: FUSC family protein [Stellaceae bacterium]|nr:FUSC family protein [Stellaceae bacterium]